MARRRRAQRNHLVQRQTRWLNLTRLEDRLAPAISIMGPHSPTELDTLRATGANNWAALGQLPEAPGLVSHYQVEHAWHFQLNHAGVQQHLEDVPFETAPGQHDGYFEMMIPRPDGSFQLFNVWEILIMEPGLAAQFPTIKTYRGQGVDDPYATLSADLTPAGFHAQVLSPHGAFYLEPFYHQSTSVYIGYYKAHNVTPHAFYCSVGEEDIATHQDDDDDCGCGHPTSCGCSSCLAAALGSTAPAGSGFGLFNSSNGATLRQYRLAVAATGEYTAYHGGTVALGQAAIVTAMNRVNQVYESQLSVRMNLIANNSSLVYTNPATDPYTNGNGSTMLGENQTNIDTVIGNANYDIGHVFSTGGGGVAGLGVVGITGQKARGVTGQSNPIGDSFWIDYVAHEMGHQFGAAHTFNGIAGSCGSNRSASNAYEQGSGSTIMAYAGICGGDNIQSNSDAYFHWRSLDQISTLISSGAAVGFTQTATGNAIPVVNPGPNYTIPAQTPFALTGSATDANNDPLTYLWEEADLGPATNITTPDNGTSPLFRSFSPSTSPTRIVPRLQNLLANTNSPGEVLPSTNRTLNWRLTVFDNRTTGAFAFAPMAVTVVNTGAAFMVTSPNTAVTWQGLSAQTVTWNVAGTTGSGINAATVDILLSTDGGFTFPIVLAAGLPNDGSEIVTIPNLPTTQARIKVQPTNNIFFDLSNSNFTIAAASPFQVVSSTPANGSTAAAPMSQFDVTFTTDVKAATIGTNDLVLSQGTVTAAELLNPTTVRYTLAGVPLDGPLTVTMPNNAVTDNSNNGNGQYIANITIDAETVAFPTLTANAPVGTLGYSGNVAGAISTTTDTDSFTLDLAAGQLISVSAAPNATLRPQISVTGPGGLIGSQAAAANGQAALLQTLAASTAGTYTITVGNAASTTGTYLLQVDLNTAQEAESVGGSANDTLAAAQNIAGSGLPLGNGIERWAVRGMSEQGTPPALTDEIEPNNSAATANDARYDFTSLTSNLYHMSLSGTIGVGGDANDYFNIGAMQVGDVITISQSGSLSNRGTMLDPLVNLIRSNSGAGQLMVQDNNGGVFNGTNGDALIFRYTVTVADTYYINAQRSGTTTAGTYQLGLWLENASTPPNTGGSLFQEGTGANGQISTAENASASWRAVQYLSTINGTITAGDVDYYRFDFTAGDIVTFNMASTSSLAARINLRNSVGTIIALENGTSTGPGNSSPIYGYRITTTGTYYLECLAASGTGTYTINTYLSSTAALPTPVIGDDFYRLTLPAGANISVALDGQTPGTLNLELLNSGGASLASGAGSATNFDRGIQYVTPAAGDYFFRVNGAGDVPYYLTVVSGAAIDAEPNDSFAAAQPLFNDQVVGGITGTDDWFIIPATSGQLLTLATTTPFDTAGLPNNTLDPRIELYDPSGTLVASDDNSAADGRNALLVQAAALTGDYRAKISGVAGTTGEYTLAVTYSNDPPPTVAAFVVGDGTNQRSTIRNLTVTFSEVVTLPTPNSGAFQLTRTGPGGPMGNVDVAVDLINSTPTQTVARLSFAGPLTEFGSLMDGLYTFTILGSEVVDAGLQPLDGDGNGTPGGDFVVNLHRLFGDSNGDRSVTATDFNNFRLVYGSGPSIFDFDDDGQTGAIDFNEFRLRYGVSI